MATFIKVFALKNNIRTISLQQAQDIDNLIFISLEYDCLIRPQLFRTRRLYNLHFSALPQYKGMYTSAIPSFLAQDIAALLFTRLIMVLTLDPL